MGKYSTKTRLKIPIDLHLDYFYSRIVHTGNARNVAEKYVLFAALSPHFGRATCTVFCWIPRFEYTLHISFPMSRSYILCEFYFFSFLNIISSFQYNSFWDDVFLTSGDKFITLVPEGIVLTPLLVTCLLCITYICLLLPMRFNIKKKTSICILQQASSIVCHKISLGCDLYKISIAFLNMGKFSRMSVIFVLVTVTITDSGEVTKITTTENYCPYFKNRAPAPQPSLKNCTWYNENACCLQTELDLIFPEVLPLLGASDKCSRYTNFLMCYVCAPDQNLFYNDERLTVCEAFCDKWFAACGEAKLKGMKIKGLFKSGREFCQARKFSVGDTSGLNCFSYDKKIESSALVNVPALCVLWFAAITAVLYVHESL